MVEAMYSVMFAGLLACSAMCLYRIGRGPSAPDRAVAMDILGILVVGFTVLLALKTGRDFYVNVGIVWAMLSFIGAIALAKYLEGKEFDE